ncbi:MAG: hypothetical protein WC997_02425 [Porticoccaceae bacterium]
MGAFSNYLEEKIVEHFLRNNAVASPATVYLALFETDPGEGIGGDETSYVNYVRMPSTWTAIDGNGQTKNGSTITFAPNGNGSASVTITHAAIYDAASGGNRLLYGPLASPKTLAVGDVLSFAANALTLTLD